MHVALTGAATGIGAAVAARLKRGGHRVTGFDITEPEAHCDHWIRVDLADPASIDAAIAASDGPYDALINNAGLPPRDDNAFSVLNVNFLGMRRFLTGMTDQVTPGGAIVNTASRAGAMWRDNLDQVKALLEVEDAGALAEFVKTREIDPVRAYNLSKEAVIVLTMAATRDMVARGLRMNSVSPSAVSTGILDDFLTAFGDRVTQNLARVGRPGSAEEIADVIVFLAGPDSAWLNGVDIVTDGGMSAMIAAEMMGLNPPLQG